MNASPQQELNHLICGYGYSQCVYVAARLGIADFLARGPLSIDELAARTETQPQSLFRVLRALASVGIFAEEEGKRFRLTPSAELLRSDARGSQRALAILMGEEYFRAWGDLLFSVRTGKPAFDRIYGEPLFDFLSENPRQAANFDRAMVAAHGYETAALFDAYDFRQFTSVTDIGGGNGNTLCGILARHPELHGTLYDLPGVIERARHIVEKAGMAKRIQLIAGDFFQSAPADGDAYLLRHIIHDWDDQKAARILRNIRQVISRDAKLLVVDSVIPEGNEPFFSKLLDLTMLVCPGGQERTREEFRQLFAQAGFRLGRVVRTTTEDSVIEGIPE
jgi:O-methyltransferase domain/Dimerisation domain